MLANQKLLSVIIGSAGFGRCFHQNLSCPLNGMSVHSKQCISIFMQEQANLSTLDRHQVSTQQSVCAFGDFDCGPNI